MQTRLLMIQYDDITGGYQGSNYTEYSALLHITIIYITIYTIVRLSSSPAPVQWWIGLYNRLNNFIHQFELSEADTMKLSICSSFLPV